MYLGMGVARCAVRPASQPYRTRDVTAQEYELTTRATSDLSLQGRIFPYKDTLAQGQTRVTWTLRRIEMLPFT